MRSCYCGAKMTADIEPTNKVIRETDIRTLPCLRISVAISV